MCKDCGVLRAAGSCQRTIWREAAARVLPREAMAPCEAVVESKNWELRRESCHGEFAAKPPAEN